MKKTDNFWNKYKSFSISYFFTNRLFISYVILSLIGCLFLRGFTIGKALAFKPVITDVGAIVLLGSFGYFIKPNKQYHYFMTVLCFISFLCIANSIYYTFYTNFASVGELATLSQAETVTGSIFERIKLLDFIYILLPFIFRYTHKVLLTSPYYNYLLKIQI